MRGEVTSRVCVWALVCTVSRHIEVEEAELLMTEALTQNKCSPACNISMADVRMGAQSGRGEEHPPTWTRLLSGDGVETKKK